MCGIAGYAGNGKEWLPTAVTKLKHRGPDDDAMHFVDSVGFAHTRLSIIDLSKNGKQPIESWNYILTYNGEIYNYNELRSYLNAYDDLGNINGGNDAYTFLAFAEKYGLETALNRSNGMFAFGLYDKNKKTITCVVDRFGQKPLYYYQTEDSFYFASTPAALYNLKQRWKIDHQALDKYFMLGALMGPDHLIQGIKKLCAGQMLTYEIESKKLKVSQWYEIQPLAEVKDIEPYIWQAIDAVKVSDVPVNLFLSGGIDSTLVASRFKNTQAVHLRSPEEGYALAVANKYNLNLRIVDPEEFHIWQILTDYSEKSGEPTMAGAIPWITAKYAKKYGKVAIIANGADELFFGYDRIQGDTDNESIKQNYHLFRGSAYPRSLMNAYRLKHNGKPSSRVTELMTFVQFDINRTLDFAAMCHGLEVRSPFLDHRLVEAALSIPEKKHRYKGNKTLLKAILHKLGFEMSFTERPKQGFSMHYKPLGFENSKIVCYDWAQYKGYLDVKDKVLTPRDLSYIQTACVGLNVWYDVHKNMLR